MQKNQFYNATMLTGFLIRLCEPNVTTILLLSYPGELFIRMLKLMILPLVIASLIAGKALQLLEISSTEFFVEPVQTGKILDQITRISL